MQNVSKRWVAALALAALLAGVAPARAALPGGRTAGPSVASTSGSPQMDSWLGVGAAIGCGFGARYFSVLVTVGGPGWTAAWVGTCLIMVIDAMAENP